jgi:hypothetical protein
MDREVPARFSSATADEDKQCGRGSEERCDPDVSHAEDTPRGCVGSHQWDGYPPP